MGYTQEAIDKMRERREKPVEVETWNWSAVKVYLLCDLRVQMDMGVPVYTGIDLVEIECACRLAGEPFDQDTVTGVRVMAGAACETYNSRHRRNAR